MGGQTFKTNWNLCRQNLTTMFNCTADLLIPCNTTWVLPFPNVGSSATEEELRILVVGWFHCTRPALWGHHGWPAGLLSCQFPILSISKQCNQHNRCTGTLSFERLNIWTLFYSYINLAFLAKSMLWSVLDHLINNAPPVNQGFLVFADLSPNLHEFQMGSRNFAPSSNCLCNYSSWK